MPRSLHSSIEALEARIAPAGLAVLHPLFDLMPGLGKTGASIDLGTMFDASASSGYRSMVEFTTNFDVDTATPGLQPGKIILELFDDKAPLTVQNFISYVENANARGDFDGVYFHRLVSGFVLQTGGYEAKDPAKHIVTQEPVHNEFTPNDPERSNLYGTVAMAKVGGDPNSATSEWFVNLNDNSGNLDAQNGGFTVFGKVVKGMGVVNAIASAPTFTLNGASVPYQNGFNPDPDNNANTPSPAPKANQLISFTDAKVLPPKQSTIANASYSVLGVFDSSGNPSDLVKTNANPVTHQLHGDTLKLSYKPGGAGTVTVKVQVKDPANPSAAPIVEDFLVKLQPNLVAHADTDTLPTTAVAGDTGKVTVKLNNTAGGAAIGKVDVKFYLSHIDGTDSDGNALGSDPTGTILDSNDLLIGTLDGAAVNILPGKSGTVTGNVAIPADTALAAGGYRLIAKVSQAAVGGVLESYTDDNVTLDGAQHNFFSGGAKTNLSTSGLSEDLETLLIPGDTGLAKFSLKNTSGLAAVGDVNVQVYLSYDATPLSSTDTLDVTTDYLIGSVSKSINLLSGNSATFDVPLTVPEVAGVTDGYYRVFGLITTPNGNATIQELSSGDNQSIGNYHLLQRNFGTFKFNGTLLGDVERKDAPFVYKDAGGHRITLKISGSGYGAVTTSDTGGITVSLENTNLSSTFSAQAFAGVRPVLENVFAGALQDKPIGAIVLGNTDWTGQVVAYGGARSIFLGNTSGDGDHFVGVGTSKAAKGIQPAVRMGAVQDLSLSSEVALRSLSAATWRDVNSSLESVDAVGLKEFKVAGNFEADMHITAANPGKTAAMNTFAVKGAVKNSEINISANVGSVQLGAIEASNFLVGADSVPAAAADFSLARTIGSLVIRGGVAGQAAAFSDSNIAASSMGSVQIGGSVDTSSGVDIFGVIADKIASYHRRGGATVSNADAPRTFDHVGNYQVTVV